MLNKLCRHLLCQGCSTNTFGIIQLTEWSLSSQSSTHHKSQTVRARDFTFLHNGHHPLYATWHMSCVTCHVSCVMCHVSCVMCLVSRVKCHMSGFTCQVSHVTYFFLFSSFFGRSGEAGWWRVCYQWGLPRLVSLAYQPSVKEPSPIHLRFWLGGKMTEA